MTKEVFIALIQKDIRELEVLTQGLNETDIPSATMLTLASAKAKEVVDNLQKLVEFNSEAKLLSKEIEELSKPIPSKEEPITQPKVMATTLEEAHKLFKEINATPASKEIEKIVPIITSQPETKTESLSKPKDEKFLNSLLNKKITDLKQAINIADRFRFQRELFANSAEKMNETCAFLNTCSSMEEANKYLSSNFDWKPENETAEEFLSLVHRLFV